MWLPCGSLVAPAVKGLPVPTFTGPAMLLFLSGSHPEKCFVGWWDVRCLCSLPHVVNVSSIPIYPLFTNIQFQAFNNMCLFLILQLLSSEVVSSKLTE